MQTRRAYRQFYGMPSDLERATSYIRGRLTKRESVVVVALDDQQVVGFCQLYPTFCSVIMRPIQSATVVAFA